MNANEVPAGRELDALISEQVMGIPVVCHDWPCGYSPDCGEYEAAMFVLKQDGKYISNSEWNNSRGPVVAEYLDLDYGWPPYEDAGICGGLIAHVEPVPFYSADIAAAWQIVEKLIANGATPQIYFSFGQWWVRLSGLGAAVGSETLPLAICRAALEAAGQANECN